MRNESGRQVMLHCAINEYVRTKMRCGQGASVFVLILA